MRIMLVQTNSNFQNCIRIIGNELGKKSEKYKGGGGTWKTDIHSNPVVIHPNFFGPSRLPFLPYKVISQDMHPSNFILLTSGVMERHLAQILILIAQFRKFHPDKWGAKSVGFNCCGCPDTMTTDMCQWGHMIPARRHKATRSHCLKFVSSSSSNSTECFFFFLAWCVCLSFAF